jgi:predicted nucleic acid-binding protein
MFFSLGLKVSNVPDDWAVVAINDRDDDNFLWAAVAGNAEYIISEDSHILKLKAFKDIPIGTPADFFRWAQVAHPVATSQD